MPVGPVVVKKRGFNRQVDGGPRTMGSLMDMRRGAADHTTYEAIERT